jgi:hypothetical protein
MIFFGILLKNANNINLKGKNKMAKYKYELGHTWNEVKKTGNLQGTKYTGEGECGTLEDIEFTVSGGGKVIVCGCCGNGIRYNEKEGIPQIEGYVCPTCGHVFSRNNTLTTYTWSDFSLSKVCFDEFGIVITNTKWRMRIKDGQTASHKIIDFENCGREVESYSYKTALAEAPYSVVKSIHDAHPEYFPVGADYFIKYVTRDNDKHYWVNHLNVIADIATRAPYLAEQLIKGFAKSGWDLDRIYASYPEYLLPLTNELIRSYNPYYEITKTYGVPKVFLPFSKYKNKDNVHLVVNYYKSGLISFNQMDTILSHPGALNNPNFERIFKSYYTQMAAFVHSLSQESENLETHEFDVRTYYMDKTIGHLEETCKYTKDQIYTAFNSSSSYLDAIIKLGSTRRSSK